MKDEKFKIELVTHWSANLLNQINDLRHRSSVKEF